MNAAQIGQPAINRSYNPDSIQTAAQMAEKAEVKTGSESAAQVPSDAFESSSETSANDNVRLIFSFSKDASKAATQAFKEAQVKAGATIAADLPLVNGCSMDVKSGDIGRIMESLPEGTAVAEDSPMRYSDPTSLLKSTSSASASGKKEPPKDIAKALVGIEDVWDMGFTGKGQTIAVIDSGIYPHPDLKDKIVGWVDLQSGETKPTDTYGHGTHVAGIAAGSGIESAGVHKGVAPDANVVGVRISNVSEAIKGIQWVIENKERLGISVINMSLGDFAARSYKDDPWAQAAEKAMDAGLVVCVAAGNDGPSEMNISTPGIHPDVITVGALDDKGTEDRSDDMVAEFSSRGPTNIDGINKPDLVAPGVDIYGPMVPGASVYNSDMYFEGTKYVTMSGTSMATPMVAGLAACLKQANPDLTQKDIKSIIVQSCDKYLDEPKYVQGAGLINAKKAVQLALTWKFSSDMDELSRPAEAAVLAKNSALSQSPDSAGFLMLKS